MQNCYYAPRIGPKILPPRLDAPSETAVNVLIVRLDVSTVPVISYMPGGEDQPSGVVSRLGPSASQFRSTVIVGGEEIRRSDVVAELRT